MSTESTRDEIGVGTVRRIQTALRDLTGELGRLNQVVGEHVELRPGDLEVLDVVARRGPLSPSQLAETLSIHPATLTGIIDRLEQGGWAARAADPTDRRRVSITALRKRGGELTRLYGPMSRSIAELCASYTPAQLEAIGAFLEQAAAAGRRAVEASRLSMGPD